MESVKIRVIRVIQAIFPPANPDFPPSERRFPPENVKLGLTIAVIPRKTALLDSLSAFSEGKRGWLMAADSAGAMIHPHPTFGHLLLRRGSTGI